MAVGIVNPFHRLPPVGMLHGGANVLRAYRASRQKFYAEADPVGAGPRHLFDFNTGKAALLTALRAMAHLRPNRTDVVVPAYTCFSVAAAVKEAGLRLVLCDVDPSTLDFKKEMLGSLLSDRTLCILGVHLFGIPVQIERLRAVADEVGAFLMEDSAQWDERNELGMVADAMIRSFGRGKPRSTLGGGMLIAKREDIATAIARMQASSGAQSNGGLCEVLGFLASDLFIRPGLYWMPAQCPFLGLGKTIYPNDIPVGRMTRFRLELLAILEARDAALARTRARNARCYAARLQETSGHAQIAGTESAGYAPARFPFYVSSSVADAGARRLREASHLGIVRMYPHGLQELEQIQQVFVNKGMDFSGAEWIAGHLLTAPTHQWVDDRMRSRISDFIASHAA